MNNLLLFETIKVYQKKLWNIDLHSQRFNYSRNILFGVKDSINLKNHIRIPENIGEELYKCRVIYDKEKILKIEFETYQTRIIQNLKIIESNEIDYSFKYYDRKILNYLFEKRNNCDDILIVKNGFITDTSFCNVLLFDGRDWLTPSTPLLKGTKREQLLKEGKIKEQEIRLKDLQTFKKIQLINVMMDFENSYPILIKDIHF